MSEKSLMTLSDEVTSNMGQLLEFSKNMAMTQFVPKAFQNKSGDVMACIMFGQEVGLGPMAALQNIAVINGTPSIYGDGMLAVVKNHPDFEDIKETYENETATCVVKRKGQSEVIQTFSIDDAKAANLWKKAGPWTNYPKRMQQFRARSWALRDCFPDVLKGLIQAEEARDIPPEERNVTPEVNTEKKEAVTDSIKKKVKKTKKVEEVQVEETTVESEPKTVIDVVEVVEAEVVDQEEIEEKPKDDFIQKNKEEIVRKIKTLSYHAHISVKEAKTIEEISAADPIDKLNHFYGTLEKALFKRAQKALKDLGKKAKEEAVEVTEEEPGLFTGDEEIPIF